MASTRNGFLIFILCLSSLGAATIQTCKGDDKGNLPFQKRHVSVHNALKGFALQVHCWSKEDDLGVQQLAPGETYQFGFSINWSITTLYNCELQCKFGKKSFVAYQADLKYFFRCGPGNLCAWQGGEFGVQLFNAKTGKWEWPIFWDPLDGKN